MENLTNWEINDIIAKKLNENKIQIISRTETAVLCRKAYIDFEISFEMCTCHGGRLSISENNHLHLHRTIEHNCYDENLGITDPQSELLWSIENEMMEIVDNYFSKFVYKVVETGKYSDGDCNVSYHCSEEDVCEKITGSYKGSIYTLEEHKHQYLNPVCWFTVKRIYKDSIYSWDSKKVWFEIKSTSDNGKTFKTYELYFEIFNKG